MPMLNANGAGTIAPKVASHRATGEARAHLKPPGNLVRDRRRFHLIKMKQRLQRVGWRMILSRES